MTRIKLIFICSLISVAAKSQDVSWGLKGGLNFSDIVLNGLVNPDLEADYKMKVGWHGGVFTTLQLDKTWGISAEVLYSLKGVNAAGTNINLHYAGVPLLLKYSYSERFKIEAGAEVAYLFLANSKYGNVSDVYDNRLDIGAIGGCEFRLSDKLYLGARFDAGFSSVIQPDTQGATGIKYQNRTLQLSLGYSLGKASVK
jgi:hypothetical protein